MVGDMSRVTMNFDLLCISSQGQDPHSTKN